MSKISSENKLVQDYEIIRRREYELITGMLDVLPRIDNVGEQQIGQVRDAMFHADHPYLMVLIGPFSSGKSSIINALLGKEDFLRIGLFRQPIRLVFCAGVMNRRMWGQPVVRILCFILRLSCEK